MTPEDRATQEATGQAKRLANRLEALTAESQRRIAAKDRVIVDQEQVIIGLERQLQAAVERAEKAEPRP